MEWVEGRTLREELRVWPSRPSEFVSPANG
jgi:hypothetical protein